MRKWENININNCIGVKFNMLYVLDVIRGVPNKVFCVCDCGNLKLFVLSRLKDGGTKSCGCFRKKRIIAQNWIHGHCQRHNRTTEFKIWDGIIERCYNNKSPHFKNYGAKGVKMHNSWKNSFSEFYKYIGRRPSIRHSLDRYPNHKGNYEPGNVRWATWKEQANNKSNNLLFIYKNKVYTISQIADKLSVKYYMVNNKLINGWTIDEIFKYHSK